VHMFNIAIIATVGKSIFLSIAFSSFLNFGSWFCEHHDGASCLGQSVLHTTFRHGEVANLICA